MRLIINGASGKMGQLAITALAKSDHDIVAKLNHEDDLKKTLSELKPDAVLDLTSAEVVLQNTKTIIESGCRPIIGTSGLTEEAIYSLQTLSKKNHVGGIIVPNFSLGAVLMIQFAEKAARYFPRAEIIEKHHDQKKDAPSGTSLYTAQKIHGVRQNQTVACKETITGALGANVNDIPIHSVRLSGLLAHQEVIFGDTGETLTIKHDSLTRDCFAAGIALACDKVMELGELIVGLEHLL